MNIRSICTSGNYGSIPVKEASSYGARDRRAELGDDFDLTQLLNRGYLSTFYSEREYSRAHQSYVADYLREEVLAEGLIRSLPVFSRFLEVAAIGDTEILNYSNVGREAGVSPKTAQAHYEKWQKNDEHFFSSGPVYRVAQVAAVELVVLGGRVLARRGRCNGSSAGCTEQALRRHQVSQWL